MEAKRVKTKSFLELSLYLVAQKYIFFERVISGEIE